MQYSTKQRMGAKNPDDAAQGQRQEREVSGHSADCWGAKPRRSLDDREVMIRGKLASLMIGSWVANADMDKTQALVLVAGLVRRPVLSSWACSSLSDRFICALCKGGQCR